MKRNFFLVIAVAISLIAATSCNQSQAKSEPENDDGSRMDLVITYNRKEYIIELKIWHGTEYEISGRDQLAEYLTTHNLSEGYLVTFSFLKNKVVQAKPEWIKHEGKKIYEAVI